MKKLITPLLFLFLGLAASAPAQEPHTINDVGWLAGCWDSVGGERGSGEQWTAAAGGTMLGVSRTVRNGKTTMYEYLQIRETENNSLELVALPSGQTGATFTLIGCSMNSVVFENTGHDFPQRIIYRLMEDGNLEARIEGLVEGEPQAVDFFLHRVDCEAGSLD